MGNKVLYDSFSAFLSCAVLPLRLSCLPILLSQTRTSLTLHCCTCHVFAAYSIANKADGGTLDIGKALPQIKLMLSKLEMIYPGHNLHYLFLDADFDPLCVLNSPTQFPGALQSLWQFLITLSFALSDLLDCCFLSVSRIANTSWGDLEVGQRVVNSIFAKLRLTAKQFAQTLNESETRCIHMKGDSAIFSYYAIKDFVRI